MQRHIFYLLALIAFTWPAWLVGQVAKLSDAQLKRDRLLFYLDPAGKVQPVQSIRDWQKRRASIHEAMQKIMGPLPGKEKHCPLDMKVEEEVDCGTYVRRLISYQSEPGMRTPAYLLIPKKVLAGKVTTSAVLSLHPTSAKGFRVTVGLGETMNREYGVELAERGYVVIALPYPRLSDYNPDLKKLGYKSGTMKAIWDNRRGLDLLESLPFVAKKGFAAIGHSLGGHNSVYTAAFDERIKAVVSSCGLDSFRDYMNGNIKGWTSTRYMPKLLDYKVEEIPFDFHEIVGAIAPREVFISAPIGDTNFRYKSVDGVAKSARAVFALYKAEDRLRVAHPDTAHVFSKDMRDEASRVIDGALK